MLSKDQFLNTPIKEISKRIHRELKPFFKDYNYEPISASFVKTFEDPKTTLDEIPKLI